MVQVVAEQCLPLGHVLLGRGGGGDGLEQFGEFLSGLAGALLSSRPLGP
jgi:hypothetical protein